LIDSNYEEKSPFRALCFNRPAMMTYDNTKPEGDELRQELAAVVEKYFRAGLEMLHSTHTSQPRKKDRDILLD
jgi:hypothetical protein